MGYEVHLPLVHSNKSFWFVCAYWFYVECIDLEFCLNSDLSQMTVRDALNSALDEEMSADPKVFLMGEEVTVGITSHNIFWNPFPLSYLF